MRLCNGFRFCVVLAVSGFLTLACISRSDAASFMGVGDLTGGTESSRANGVSGDGSVVVGGSNSVRGREAFRWENNVIEPLGDLTGGSFDSSATGVSDDGGLIVGSSSSILGPIFEAFRWTPGNMIEPLGALVGNSHSQAWDVSGDGKVAVGWSSTNSSGTGVTEAVRWTFGGTPDIEIERIGGPQSGNFFSMAYGVSGDGSVVVGRGQSARGNEAFRWENNVIEPLGDLHALEEGRFFSAAFDVSADGSVVVGQGQSARGNEAFRWKNGFMEPLGDLTGGSFESSASGVSADGSVVVGRGSSASGTEAFIWDSDNEMQRVASVLISSGVDLTGWTLTDATSISDDGLTIVGYGTNPSNHTEGWVAKLDPEPPDPWVLLVIALAIGLVVVVGSWWWWRRYGKWWREWWRRYKKDN